MEIITKNNQKIVFRQISNDNFWVSIFENDNYNFSFKNNLRLKEYIIENYEFENNMKTFIDYFISNEQKILKISRKIIDDILSINNEKHTTNEENSKLTNVHILDIVTFAFRLNVSTEYGYLNYEISFVSHDKENLEINKIIKTQCY